MVAGCAEIGFVEDAVENAALVVTELAQDRLIVVVAPCHPWAGRGEIATAEILGTAWVLREPGSGTRTIFEAALAELSVAPSPLDVALDLPRNEAVISAVQAGLGATAVSANAAVTGLEAGLLVQVPMALPDRRFLAVRQAGRRLSHASSALVAALQPPPA